MHDLGDTLAFSARLYDKPPEAGGVLVNAVSVALTITLPDGTTAPGVTVTSPPAVTGTYQHDHVTTTMPGLYLGRWLFTMTGGKTTAHVETFDVRPAAPGYLVSLADAKAHLNKQASGTVDDDELRGFMEACTEVIELLAGQVIVRRTVVESRTFDYATTKLALHSAPVLALTAINALDGPTTWSPATWHVATDGLATMLPGGRPLYGLVQLTYVAGYALIPARLTRAALVLLDHLWDTQRAGRGRRRGSGGFGDRQGDEDGLMVSGFAVPRAVVELVGSPMPGVA